MRPVVSGKKIQSWYKGKVTELKYSLISLKQIFSKQTTNFHELKIKNKLTCICSEPVVLVLSETESKDHKNNNNGQNLKFAKNLSKPLC